MSQPRPQPATTPFRHTDKSPSNQEFLRNTQSFLTRYTTNYTPPVAQMTVTPSGNKQSSEKALSTIKKGKARAADIEVPPLPSASKDTQYFQDQANKANEALDLTDFDFPTPPPTAKKRRAEGDLQSPRSKQSKLSHSNNHKYEEISKGTKAERDIHIERIVANWKVSWEHWMPTDLMPRSGTKTKSCSGKGKSGKPPMHPRDWNNPLLMELAHFSAMTKDHQEKAFEALRESVTRKDRCGHGPQLLKTDVQYAIKHWSVVATPEPVAATPLGGLPHVSPRQTTHQPRFQATVEEDNDNDLFMPMRSPTLVQDNIKVESSAAAASRPAMTGYEATGYEAWDDVDDPITAMKYKLKAIQNECRANILQSQIVEETRRRRLKAMGLSVEDAIPVGLY